MFQQRANELIIHRMPRLAGCVDARERSAGQHQIANRVQQFMTDKLVIAAQAFRINNLVAINHDRIVQRSSARQSHGPQGFDITREPKRPGKGNIAGKQARDQAHGHLLCADRLGVKFDLGLEGQDIIL